MLSGRLCLCDDIRDETAGGIQTENNNYYDINNNNNNTIMIVTLQTNPLFDATEMRLQCGLDPGSIYMLYYTLNLGVDYRLFSLMTSQR